MIAAWAPRLAHRLAVLWRSRRDGRASVPPAQAAIVEPPSLDEMDADGQPLLKIWLFGGLAPVAACRSFTVPLDAPTSLRSLMAMMVERFGPAFRELVMQDNGQIYGCCRLFLDGFPVEVDDIIDPARGPRNLELIVLTSSEGG